MSHRAPHQQLPTAASDGAVVGAVVGVVKARRAVLRRSPRPASQVLNSLDLSSNPPYRRLTQRARTEQRSDAGDGGVADAAVRVAARAHRLRNRPLFTFDFVYADVSAVLRFLLRP
jgi:hypothetical protein